MLTGLQIIEALRDARVPARYHRPECKLGNYGKGGTALATWITSGQAGKDLRSGIGKFCMGEKQSSVDAFFTLARSLTITGVSVKVFSLPMLVRQLGTPELVEELQDCSALCVLGFYEPKHAGAFSAAQLNELEWFFRSRWNSDLATIFLGSSRISECAWWSKSFLDSVRTFNPDEVAL